MQDEINNDLAEATAAGNGLPMVWPKLKHWKLMLTWAAESKL